MKDNKNSLSAKKYSTRTENKQLLLNPKYTFENLIKGESNQMAYSVAKSICNNEKNPYNPFIIFGESGLGKSHLVQSIGNCLEKEKMVIYTTVEKFMNELTSHLRQQTMDIFRKKYRTCDLLIIEDIEYLSNKQKTQEELFFIIEELIAKNKQIVLTSRLHPNKKQYLGKRLLSKLLSGLIVEIKPYEISTRIEIVKMKAEIYKMKLPHDIVVCIAKSTESYINEIEGMLKKIHAYFQFLNMDIKLVKKLLKHDKSKECKKILA